MKKFDKILSCKVFKKKVLFNLEHNWGFYIAISNDNIINFELFDKNNKKVLPKIINEKNHIYENTNVSKYKNYYVIKSQLTKIKVHDNPFRITVYRKIRNNWQEICSDRETGSWYWNEEKNETTHYQNRYSYNNIYGLGEKTGNLEKSYRRYILSQKDALGYNGEKSDPLYKSFPWLYIINKNNRNCDYGLLYNTLGYGVVDLGSEHSNYHHPYRYANFQNKGIQLFIFINNKQSIISSLNNFIGPRYFPPKWSLGFQFSSMEIADDENSQKLYLEFLNKCKELKIPLSSLHFGSGYTLHGKKRYMFKWNKKKFPQPKLFLDKIKQYGIHLTANLKPAILTSHPLYRKAVKEKIFISDNNNKPIVIQFWDETASIIDFTKKTGSTWWKKYVTKYILSNGFDAIWNDNNEYDLEGKDAYSLYLNKKVKTNSLLPLQAILMSKASSQATRNYYPRIRNHGVTRSGTLGIQRYVETWTGDNDTSWHSLKWSASIGLGLSLSGIGFFGHDIGGFTGKKTSRELMIRSLQLMLFHPRFHMNSWKPNTKKQNKNKNILNLNNTNLPWLYNDTIPAVRKLIQLRYQLLPILYSAIWRFYKEGEPVIRPLFLDFPEKEHFEQEEVFSINERIIVAPVLVKKRNRIKVFLPFCREGWFDYFNLKLISNGGWVNINAPINKLPIIIRGGTVIPKLKINFYEPHLAPINEIVIFPSLTDISFKQKNLPLIFDDGKTIDYEINKNLILTPVIKFKKNKLSLLFNLEGKGKIQKEQIILKYPNSCDLILKNCLNYFKIKSYNYKIKK